MLSHGLKTPPFGSFFISNSSRISRYWKLSGETGGHVMFSNNSSLSGVGFLKVFVLNYYYLRQITLFYIFFIENISTYTTQEKLRGLISLLHPWPIYKPSIIFQFIPQHFVFGWGTFSDNKQNCLERDEPTMQTWENVMKSYAKVSTCIHPVVHPPLQKLVAAFEHPPNTPDLAVIDYRLFPQHSSKNDMRLDNIFPRGSRRSIDGNDLLSWQGYVKNYGCHTHRSFAKFVHSLTRRLWVRTSASGNWPISSFLLFLQRYWSSSECATLSAPTKHS